MGKRIAIIGVHGIGFSEPYAFAASIAKSLKRWLAPMGGSAWETARAYIQMPRETKLSDMPAYAIRVAVPDEPDTPIIDVYGPGWSSMTKGFTKRLTLARWIGRAFHALATGFRTSGRKTALEQWMLAGYIASGFALLALPLVAALDFAARHVAGPWYSVLLAGLTLLYAVASFVDAALLAYDAKPKLRDFVMKYRELKGHFLAERLMASYLHVQTISGQRAHTAVRMLLVLGRVYKLSLFIAVPLAFFAITGVHWNAAPAVTLDSWEFLALAVLPPVALMVLRALAKAFGPLEDIYTFATCRYDSDIYNRKMVVIDECAQAIVDALHRNLVGTDEPFYDEVYVFGHSMGSVIALRAVARVHEAYTSGIVTADDYARLKGLVSYGAAIEKVLAYFALPALQYSVMEATALIDAREALESFNKRWVNLYYLSDLVADRCESYGALCENVKLPSPPVLWSHSAYLDDRHFWDAVVGVMLPGQKTAIPATWLDRIDQVVGRFDQPIPAVGVTPAGVASVALMFASLFAAMFVIGHSHSLFGPILGLSMPLATIAILQLARK
jgi:hypothetical protein